MFKYIKIARYLYFVSIITFLMYLGEKTCANAAQFDLTYGLLQFFQYLNDTEINMSSSGWWPGPYRREFRKIIKSGWKSDVKKARGLDGEIEKVFGERERLRGLNS